MGTYRDPKTFAGALMRAKNAHRTAMEAAMRAQSHLRAQQYSESAISLLSGTTSSRTLALLGHPFARRHPSLGVGILPINVQSGLLLESLQLFVKRSGADTWDVRLENDAPYAFFHLSPFNQGTSTMKPRGFWSALEARMTIYPVSRQVFDGPHQAVTAALGG